MASLLKGLHLLPRNYGYIFDSSDPSIASLTSSLVSAATSCGAILLPSTASISDYKQIYLLTPTVERDPVPQYTIFWLIDAIANKMQDSPLHYPRDPMLPEWNILSGHVAVVTGYYKQERIFVRCLATALGAVLQEGFDSHSITIVISENGDKTEGNVKTVCPENIPVYSKQWLLDQFWEMKETREAAEALSPMSEISQELEAVANKAYGCAQKDGFESKTKTSTAIEQQEATKQDTQENAHSPNSSDSPEICNEDNSLENDGEFLEKDSASPRIAVSGFKLSTSETVAWESLGGFVVSGSSKNEELPINCTHLVATNIAKTPRFLLAIARGLPIVSRDWVLDSLALAMLNLDEESYSLKDPHSEAAFGFSLAESLSRAKDFCKKGKGLFGGFSFFILPSCRPRKLVLASLIHECGGAVADHNESSVDFIIAPSSKVSSMGSKARDGDWVLQSILLQQIVD